MADPIDLNSWGGLLAFAGTTGLATAILTKALDRFFEWRKSSRTETSNAAYLAIRIAVLLESYAGECSSVVSDASNYVSSKGASRSPTTEIPQPSSYPDDAESWRALRSDLVERCLSLPNRALSAQKAVQAEVELWTGPDSEFALCAEEACILGFEAWDLAVALRRKYGFPAYKPPYDYPGFLKRTHDPIMERRKKEESAEADA